MNKNHHQEHIPRLRDWKRIHHSPVFWIGVFLFIAAVMIYMLSDNLFLWPRQ
ncbi:MAG: hypothetical protein WCD70_16995 [Alphaproteobacteria bacterium]